MGNNNYKIGINLARKGEYDSALKYLYKAKAEGNIDSINDIGVIFERKRDYKKALNYYVEAASLGSSTGAFNAGNIWENGLIGKQNIQKALSYYLQSAHNGNLDAYNKISKFYVYGVGVEKDEKKGFEFCKKGSQIEKKQHYKTSLNTMILGYLYFEGIGVKKDVKKAIKLWEICVKQGNYSAEYNLAFAKLINGQDTDEAVETVIKLATTYEDRKAMTLLGELYEEGEYVTKDLHEAGKWWVEAAMRNNIDGILNIIRICAEGIQSEYGLSEEAFALALQKFKDVTNGLEEEYCAEIKALEEIKIKYPDIDWNSLEFSQSYDTDIVC